MSEPLNEAKSKIENRIEIKTESEYEGAVRGVKRDRYAEMVGEIVEAENQGVTSVYKPKEKKRRAISCLLFIRSNISCHQSPFA